MHRRSPAKRPQLLDPRGWTTCVTPPPVAVAEPCVHQRREPHGGADRRDTAAHSVLVTRYRYGQTWGDMGTTPRARSWRMRRALRAAQQPDADWARAGSHGIKVVGESTSGSFADALVRDTRNKPSDAFGWVATTLNRASLPRNIRVGDLARLLFPGGHFPLAGDDPTYPVLELAAVRDAGLSMGRDTAVGGLR